MRSSIFGHPHGWGALMVVLGLIGCEGAAVDPAADAGATDAAPEDGGARLEDAGPAADGGGCVSNAQCVDEDPCSDSFCEDGVCWARRVEGCAECASDAECDDGFWCSIETCVGGLCSYDWRAECECLDASQCDDGDPSTTDRCTSDYRCTHEARTCASDGECDDADPCTSDACEAGVCSATRIPGCGTTCPDRDGDGHGQRFCPGGDDCDDSDPSIHPSATEVCDDGVDNDCDGRVDLVDADCSLGGETCASPGVITPGTRVEAAVLGDGSGPGTGTCGTSNFHTLTLSEASDVEVTLTFEEPPRPTPVPGCPECTPDHEWQYWFNAFLETTCGDPSTDLGGAMAGSCQVWSNDAFFSGSQTMTRLIRRVPAGSYSLEVQAGDFFGWMPAAVRFSIDVTVTPVVAPACSTATELVRGTPMTGRTSGVDAFGVDCSGTPLVAEEALHSFTLTRRRRVRLEAVGEVDPASGVAPGLRVALFATCDASAPQVGCLEHRGHECHPRATLEQVLDAGTYWVAVEGYAGADHGYTLNLDYEAEAASCRDATVISGSGMTAGDTTGASDDFRDPLVCGDGYGPDDVYRIDVATRSRVVMDVIASYSDPLLTLFSDCGATHLAGGGGRSRVDLSLSAGTYYAVVGGEHAGDAGAYVLNTTFVPSP